MDELQIGGGTPSQEKHEWIVSPWSKIGKMGSCSCGKWPEDADGEKCFGTRKLWEEHKAEMEKLSQHESPKHGWIGHMYGGNCCSCGNFQCGTDPGAGKGMECFKKQQAHAAQHVASLAGTEPEPRSETLDFLKNSRSMTPEESTAMKAYYRKLYTKMPSPEYVAKLEAEIAALRERLADVDKEWNKRVDAEKSEVAQILRNTIYYKHGPASAEEWVRGVAMAVEVWKQAKLDALKTSASSGTK